MKKTILCASMMAVFAAGVSTFMGPRSVISGSVLPVNGAESIWAVGEKDSAKAVILNSGNFSLTAKSTGSYKLFVDAKSPYKDVMLDLDVKSDQPMDVGQIVLEK